MASFPEEALPFEEFTFPLKMIQLLAELKNEVNLI